MSTRAQWNSPRFSLLAILLLIASLAVVGCGGGGGSSSGSNPTTGPNTAIVTGRVIDSVSNSGVSGLTVTFPGTSISGTTATDGSFTIVNVPLSATGVLVTVSNPSSTSTHYDIIYYGGTYYYTGAGYGCSIRLPTLVNQGTAALGSMSIYNRSGIPPPPPTACP